MERLTFDGNFCDIARCTAVPGGSFCEDGYCSQRLVWERLKQYEDAEKTGLLVKLPCKVLDTVYTKNNEGMVVRGIVQSINQNWLLGSHSRWLVTAHFPEYAGSGLNLTFEFCDFGKTVFLTREAAQQALESTDMEG